MAAIADAAPVSIVDDFLDAIANRTDPNITAEDAAFITQVIEAGYESARTGKEVPLSAPKDRVP